MVWVFLFAAFGSFLIAIGQVFYLRNSKNRVAFFMYLGMGMVLLYYKFIFDFTLPQYGHLFMTGNIAGLATGCLIYYHVRSVSDSSFAFGKKHALVILGCLTIYALPLIPFWTLPEKMKGALALEMLTSRYLYGSEPLLWGVSVFRISNTIFGIISALALGLATLRLARSVDRGQIWHNFYFYMTLIIGAGFIAALIGNYGAYVGSVLMIEIIGGILGACIFGFYLVGQAFPWALYERKASRENESADTTPGTRTRLKDEDVRRIAEKLDNLLNREKLFRRSDLSLASLSAAVGCTPHQLSEYLNRIEKKRFTAFINGYRIEEAKRIFTSEMKTNNIVAARETGFNSDTHFHFVFQSLVGVSPGEFRKNAK